MCAIDGFESVADGFAFAEIVRSAEASPCRVTRQLGAGSIGDVLTAAADRELDHDRGDRGEDRAEDHGDQRQRVGAAAAVAVTSAEPQRAQQDVREQRDRAGEHGGPGHQPHVVVADVAQLVSEHALELLLVERASSPVVTQTIACFGLRPAANAFGESSLTM